MNKECCNNKKTVRSEDEKKIINNRLNRIEGQVKGIKLNKKFIYAYIRKSLILMHYR